MDRYVASCGFLRHPESFQAWLTDARARGGPVSARARRARPEREVSLFESSDVIDPSEAFVAYVGLIDHWRELPFRDPGLPEELLPDGWNAMEASALFERLVALLEGRALGYAASFWPASQ